VLQLGSFIEVGTSERLKSTLDKKHILFVDDDSEMLSAVRSALEDVGYRVTTADDGNKALEELKRETPDLIMTDLRMQPMNGFEFFQEVKKVPAYAKIPFFFMTAINDPLASKYSETLGVDAYITKPVDLEELSDLIQKRLNRK
jgi:CheY-like chemotaxis protein